MLPDFLLVSILFRQLYSAILECICYVFLDRGGIVFCINAVGRRTGEAIVVLENEEHASLALKRDRHYLGKRYVEVIAIVHVR